AHGGSFAAIVGSGAVETDGDSTLAQTFDVPAAGGMLSFWYNVHCPDSVIYDWATVTLRDNTTGTTSTLLTKTCTNTNTWKQVPATLLAGHNMTLTFVSHDDDYPGDPTYVQYDDVAILAAPVNSVVNPGFEDGLNGWTSAGRTTGTSTTKVHSGAAAA